MRNDKEIITGNVQCLLPNIEPGSVSELRYRPTFDKVAIEREIKGGQDRDNRVFSVVVYPTTGIGQLLFCELVVNDYVNLRETIPDGWTDLQSAIEFFSNFVTAELWTSTIHMGTRISKKGRAALPSFTRLPNSLEQRTLQGRANVVNDSAAEYRVVPKRQKEQANLGL